MSNDESVTPDDPEIRDASELPQAGAGNSESSIDADRIARRELMRKAAIGAAVSGAVWAAPSVEGLSLVPDYAAAATGTGAFTFTVRTTDAENNYYVPTNSAGDETPACSGSDGSYWNVQSPDNPGNTSINPGITNGTARFVTGPIGPAGSATMNVASGPANQGELNETRSDIAVTIDIDPPFNKCRVSSFVARKCNGDDATINAVNNPAPGATNPAPFTVPFTIPNQPNYLSFVQVVVSCT